MKILTFIYAMFLSFLPGLIGMFFSPSGQSDAWYHMLTKSVLTPNGWVFAAVWTLLYILLGFALFFIMDANRDRAEKRSAYALFGLHVVLNAAWTYLFFGLHLPLIAAIVIAVLIVIAILMIVRFKSISKPASYLVYPYVIWLFFALYLNASILYLN